MIEVASRPPLVAGIDLGGSRIAVSYWRGGEMVALDESKSRNANRQEALFQVVWHTMSHKLWDEVDFYFIEEPIVGRGVRASLQLSQMLGALLYAMEDAAMTQADSQKSYLVPVSVWKRQTTGKGNTNKNGVREWLEATHPAYAAQCGSNQDLIDATCIGLYGSEVVTQSGSLSLS